MSQRQAIALALVSLWIGWTLFMWFAATRSFRTVDRVLSKPQPQFSALLKPLGASTSRVVLRHFASQVNATYFRFYGLVQIVAGIIVVILLGWQSSRDTAGFVLACIMLGIVVILAAVVAPQIASIGKTLDFAQSAAASRRFWTLHGAYTSLDGIKLILGIVLVVRWVLMA